MSSKFVVLACSFKNNGRCVAGINEEGKLIRLVSEDKKTNYAIPKEECFLSNRCLQPLDVIEIDIKQKAPVLGVQTENYFVSFPLIKKYLGTVEISKVKDCITKSEKSPYPFDSKEEFLSHSAYRYKEKSLWLTMAYGLKFNTTTNREGKIKTKVTFNVYKYNGEVVTLSNYSVTDPEYYFYNGEPNRAGKHGLGKAILLISLGQEDNSDNYYKYVSGIIDLTNKK